MSIKINLNSIIKVRLTDLGRDIYYHRVDDLNEYFGCEKLKPTYPEVDGEGYTKFTLWGFMELYGSHIGMAKPNVIEPIEIICDDAQPEIIRCKDCKHWIPYDWMFSEVWRSRNINDYPEDEIGCNYCDVAMKANDFCSRAERRTDGTD